MKIVGIILAAGNSSRMGSKNKLLLKYKNHTILEEVVENLCNSKIDEVNVVTGYEHKRVGKLLKEKFGTKIKILYNENFTSGRAESIKCAIQEIRDYYDAALFMVADKPTVKSHLIDRAINKFQKIHPAILYVETLSGRGHPIIFSKEIFDDLLGLKGDRVGDDLIAMHNGKIAVLKDDQNQPDIDSPEDYNRLINNDDSH
jgi:molybdenum cofactor cytidylyltransferase